MSEDNNYRYYNSTLYGGGRYRVNKKSSRVEYAPASHPILGSFWRSSSMRNLESALKSSKNRYKKDHNFFYKIKRKIEDFIEDLRE